MNSPSVIFCNLQNSGGSAIDPILRAILTQKNYHFTPYGPEATHRLRHDLHNNVIREPFYHWTHDPVETFRGLIGNPKYRFIFLHRDPRDAAVSWAHELKRAGIFGTMSLAEILEMVVTHIQPPHVRAAVQWTRSESLTITFREIKDDIQCVMRKILSHIEYFENGSGALLPDKEIDEVVQRYSFEQLAGRRRGEAGETIRSGYMLRSGISGEWRKHFDTDILRKCNAAIGGELIALGYDFVSTLGGVDTRDTARQNVVVADNPSSAVEDCLSRFLIVSPPFACGVAWLVNALLHMNMKVTNPNFLPDHWKEIEGSSTMSERAASHLMWHLPVLHERKDFKFPEAMEGLWEHRLAFEGLGASPTILFVRDPRDAIYSLYRRNYTQFFRFETFLNRPDEWPDHFPGLFQLPPMETYAYFCAFWIAMSKHMPVKLVRFEDVKTSPNQVLREVLSFLGVSRTDSEIELAIQSSSFDSAKRAMINMEKATSQKFMTARAGQVSEWRTSYSLLAKASIRGIGRELLQVLEYATAQSGQATTVGRLTAFPRLEPINLQPSPNGRLCDETQPEPPLGGFDVRPNATSMSVVLPRLRRRIIQMLPQIVRGPLRKVALQVKSWLTAMRADAPGGNAHDLDYRVQISKVLSGKVRDQSLEYLYMTEAGRPPNPSEVAAFVSGDAVSGRSLLRLAVVLQAIYYVRRVFSDTSTKQARTALNTFVMLNLDHIHEWPIQVSAWHCLRRMESESGVPLESRLGFLRKSRLRTLTRLFT